MSLIPVKRRFVEIPCLLLQDSELSTYAKVIHALLLSYCDTSIARTLERQTVAEILGIHIVTVNESIDALEATGWITFDVAGQMVINLEQHREQ